MTLLFIKIHNYMRINTVCASKTTRSIIIQYKLAGFMFAYGCVLTRCGRERIGVCVTLFVFLLRGKREVAKPKFDRWFAYGDTVYCPHTFKSCKKTSSILPLSTSVPTGSSYSSSSFNIKCPIPNVFKPMESL